MAGSLIKTNNVAPPTAQTFSQQFNVGTDYIVTLRATGDSVLGDLSTFASDKSAGNGRGFEISGSLEETFSINMSATWRALFAGTSSDPDNKSKFQSFKNLAAAGFGLSGKNKPQTAQMWEESSAMAITIPFVLYANTDAKKDVGTMVKNILKLVAPSQALGGLALSAPGPNFAGQMTKGIMEGRQVSLRIGRFLFLDNCIVRSVDAQFDSRLDANGQPISAKVTVAIESYYACFTTDDIEAAFELKSSFTNAVTRSISEGKLSL